jgi:hypothetical protein
MIDPTMKIAPLLAAAKAKVLELPSPLTAAVDRFRRLEREADAARADARTATAAAKHLPDELVALLLAGEDVADPGARILAATTAETVALQTALVRSQTTEQAAAAIAPAFIDAAGAIGDALVRKLDAILDEALPKAELCSRLNFADPAAILAAPPAVQKAARSLEALAVANDHVRRAALAVHVELTVAHAPQRAAVLRSLDDRWFTGGKREAHDGSWISRFAGAGLAGPSVRHRGHGPSPAFDPRAWTWAPDRWPSPDPVARLVHAALGRDEPAGKAA